MTGVKCPKCEQLIKDESKYSDKEGNISLGLVCICDDEKCGHAFLVYEGITKEEKELIESEQIILLK